MIRLAETDAELGRCTAIYNALHPEAPIRLADLRADPYGRFLLHGGEGYAIVKLSSLAGCAFAMVRVLPEARRQGIGSSLLAAASDEARALGRSGLFGRVDGADTGSLGFVVRRGFVEIAREVEQIRELGAERAPQPPPGIEIRVGVEGDREGLYAVAVEATPDMALEAAIEALPADRWLAEHHDRTFHVALESGRVVGFATLAPFGAVDDTLEHELTGVLRSHRRRGIAEALKRAQIAWAAAAGYRRLVTSTQTGNEAMRSLNLKLGYRERLASIAVKGPLQ
jgi:mycothiol synthase